MLSLGIRNASARVAVWIAGCASVSIVVATAGAFAGIMLGALCLFATTRGAA
jgi:hypothetical protein